MHGQQNIKFNKNIFATVAYQDGFNKNICESDG
jgi:hypothetical protein